MYQQRSIRRFDILQAPKVGFGLLAVAMVGAFVAGILLAALVINVSRGSSTSATAITRSAPIVRPAPLSAQDFGTMPRSDTTVVQTAPIAQAAPPHLAPINVQDFGSAPRADAPAAPTTGTLNVQDFGSAPRADATP